MKQEGGWGLKPVKSLETWDNRIKIMNSIPIYQGVKKEIPLKQEIALTISDLLGFCSMVHIRIEEK